MQLRTPSDSPSPQGSFEKQTACFSKWQVSCHATSVVLNVAHRLRRYTRFSL